MTALSLLRLVPPPGRVEGGSVQLEGRDLLEFSVPQMRRVRGHEIAMIFQEPMTSLNPVATVGDQVVEAIRLHDSVSRAEARNRTRELFERVGLEASMMGQFPHQFSGGQRQRVCIARALATQPELIICDEPVSALDVAVQAQILNLLRKLQKDFGLTYLFISHDLGVVQHMSDSIAVMYMGRIVEHAETGGMPSRCVMQATRDIKCSNHLSVGHHLRRQQRPSSAQNCRFEHVWVHRIIARSTETETRAVNGI